MPNIFLKHPELLENTTSVGQTRQMDDGAAAIVLNENILRPPSGGQPCDHGSVTLGSDTWAATRIFKANGQTWIALDGCANLPSEGEFAAVEVDRARRRLLSRGHTLAHLLMASAKRVVGGFDSQGMHIGDDGRIVTVRFRVRSAPSHHQVTLLDALTRHFVLKDVPVRTSSVRQLKDGVRKYPRWRTDSTLTLGGSIRVVEIEGVDANPCSGSHVATTGEIGAYALRDWRIENDSLVTIEAECIGAWEYWFGDTLFEHFRDVDIGLDG